MECYKRKKRKEKKVFLMVGVKFQLDKKPFMPQFEIQVTLVLVCK